MTLAQNVIRGTVSDSNGPLPGANIVEQGTANGVSADFDGNFEISVADGATIEVNTGFITQIVAVDGQSSLDIVLEEDMNYFKKLLLLLLVY